ncbi:hypothetical protein [Pseudoflavitalea rhizosphaerae]|nr:hypothetical protein [Pseudoflavitalea rhizosphaerae]
MEKSKIVTGYPERIKYREYMMGGNLFHLYMQVIIMTDGAA